MRVAEKWLPQKKIAIFCTLLMHSALRFAIIELWQRATKEKKMSLKNTYHRDGTVTFWSVYQQVWTRCEASQIDAGELAQMNDSERARIARMAAKASA